jgi:hypothetical protein
MNRVLGGERLRNEPGEMIAEGVDALLGGPLDDGHQAAGVELLRVEELVKHAELGLGDSAAQFPLRELLERLRRGDSQQCPGLFLCKPLNLRAAHLLNPMGCISVLGVAILAHGVLRSPERLLTILTR